MSDPVSVANPLRYDLTEKELARIDVHPLVAGDTVVLRFQLRDEDDAAVSLSGASVVLTLTHEDTTVTRNTATLISGSTYQIKIDTDQSVETGFTGKGWYQCNFLPAETVLNDLVGLRCDYKIKVTLGDGTVLTHFKGKIDVL